MGKKGKGRQSSGFGTKSQRAAHTLEWQEQAHQAVRWHSRQNSNNINSSTNNAPALPSQRPRLTRLGLLKGILRERLSQESYELLERRRRLGFVPNRAAKDPTSTPILKAEAHPPGWMLDYEADNDDKSGTVEISTPTGSLVESLQSKCLKLLSRYILEYLDAMGKEELHSALSLLPPDTLTALSISISKGIGMSDELVVVMGKHAHVEQLCIRSATSIDRMLTDQGILELVPRLPSKYGGENEDYQETWEDWEEAYNDESDEDNAFQKRHGLVVDPLQLDGVNVGLKRLELIDCLYISADAVLALLEKCACIAHLSLAGSIQVVEDGVEIIKALPELLPALQALDVTRCGWMDKSMLRQLKDAYSRKYSFRKLPVVFCQGCFLPEQGPKEEQELGLHQDW